MNKRMVMSAIYALGQGGIPMSSKISGHGLYDMPDGVSEPKGQTDADRERMAKAEAKRQRKMAKRADRKEG